MDARRRRSRSCFFSTLSQHRKKKTKKKKPPLFARPIRHLAFEQKSDHWELMCLGSWNSRIHADEEEDKESMLSNVASPATDNDADGEKGILVGKKGRLAIETHWK